MLPPGPIGNASRVPGDAPYRLTIASLTNTPSASVGNGTSSPTSGSAFAGSSIARAISTTAGRAGSSCTLVTRCAATRSTPGSATARCGNSAGSVTTSPATSDEPARAYRSAGSTVPSHCVTESRKLATITVSATARLRLATTPATAIVAVWRWWRARSTASSASAFDGGAMPASRPPTALGTQAMPPSIRQATDT